MRIRNLLKMRYQSDCLELNILLDLKYKSASVEKTNYSLEIIFNYFLSLNIYNFI